MSSASSPRTRRFAGLGKDIKKTPNNFNLPAQQWSLSNQQRQCAVATSSLSVNTWKHFSPQPTQWEQSMGHCTAPSLCRRTTCKGSSGAHTGARVNAHTPVPSVLSAPACICLLHPESGPLTHRCPEGDGKKGQWCQGHWWAECSWEGQAVLKVLLPTQAQGSDPKLRPCQIS